MRRISYHHFVICELQLVKWNQNITAFFSQTHRIYLTRLHRKEHCTELEFCLSSSLSLSFKPVFCSNNFHLKLRRALRKNCIIQFSTRVFSEHFKELFIQVTGDCIAKNCSFWCTLCCCCYKNGT